MSTAESKSPAPASLPKVLGAGLGAGLIAAVINVIIYAIGRAADVSFTYTVEDSIQSVATFQPALSSLLLAILGAFGLWVLARLRNGDVIWGGLVGFAFVADTAYALWVAANDATGLLLSLMHIVVVVAALLIIRPSVRIK